MKYFKFSILISLFMFTAISVFATAQYPDRIIHNGKEFSLHTNPMESYFEKHPDKKPKGRVISSALWRGYVATFEFKDENLVLKDVQIMFWEPQHKTNWKSVISDVVPKNERLKIDWFTGILVLPFGEIVNYVHMGYASTYENYILLEVDKGVLKKTKEFDYKKYEEFKLKQFEAFKKTDEYKKLFQDMKKENRDVKLIESFLKDFVVNYSSKILVD